MVKTGLKPDLEDLVEEIAEIAEEEMDCEHELYRDEDGGHHVKNYFLSDKFTERVTLAIKHWLEK